MYRIHRYITLELVVEEFFCLPLVQSMDCIQQTDKVQYC
jgi:hypothetical protein